jgi:CRISPR-associated endonuclease/helicase Cas3
MSPQGVEGGIYNLNIAHVNAGRVQTVENHLVNTAVLTERYVSEIGVKDIGMLVGLLHDLGKACEDFRNYILSGEDAKGLADVEECERPKGKGFRRGEIDHSTAGAQFIRKKIKGLDQYHECAIQMAELVIVSHHSGLIDCLDGEKDRLSDRIDKDSAKTHLDEACRHIEKGLLDEMEKSMDAGIQSLSTIIKEIESENSDPEVFAFKLGLLARYILSCLVDADREDARDFEYPCDTEYRHRSEAVSWNDVSETFERYVSEKQPDTPIDCIRADISKQCLKSASGPKGIYTLSVPTGGGKTLSSLRFAIEHLRKHGMKRIFYIIPYTSIIDQNAKRVRDVLDPDFQQGIVLENHSNLDPHVNEETQKGPQRLSHENWDSPIIFTTMVQLLECIFSSGTRSVRKMHNLANSVIIFDEIQTIPIRMVYMFNEAMNFLHETCGATIVLCTATQPLLASNDLRHRIGAGFTREIVPDTKELFSRLSRVRFEYVNDGKMMSCEDVSELAVRSASENNSVLVIVNTKRSAKEIHKRVCEQTPGVQAYHLSTNMCPAHRTGVLKSINDRLKKGERIVCVSTQLVEAGVDVDFNTVIRSLAGIDSIVQAAGRCNRNGKQSEKGTTYVVNLEESLGGLEDISCGREVSKMIFHRHEGRIDLDSPDVVSEYYEQYFYERKGDMSYKLDDDSLFSLLSSNPKALGAYRRVNKRHPKSVMHQAFKTAGTAFKVIDQMKSVIVPYDGGEDDSKDSGGRKIIADLCSKHLPWEYRDILRRAQRYSVNVYDRQFNKMRGICEVEIPGEPHSGIYCLAEDQYDKTYGLHPNSEIRFMGF